MKYVLAFLDLILATILSPFLIIRTLCVKAKKQPVAVKTPPYTIDKDAAVKHLSEAVQIPTVSMTGPEYPDKPFLDFQRFLDETYPNIARIAEKTLIWDYSIVYKISGKDSSLPPVALLAHQDVVPASEEWKESKPFSGEIKDGYIYGRGTQDMKGTLIAITEAVDLMLKDGYRPGCDLYLCFGHDEEPFTTNGAKNICAYFKQNNIHFKSILDEGGAILDGNLLGIDANVCMIGTCEKGYLDATVTTHVHGGHASNPANKSAITVLAKTLQQILKHPTKSKWTPVVDETFAELAPHMKFLFRGLFVNRDVLRPLLMTVLGLIPITNAMISTTYAPTMLKGSDATNVIPGEASAVVNCRLLPIHNLNGIVEHMDKIAKKVDPNSKVTLTMGNEPSPYCSCKCAAYQLLSDTIKESFEGVVTAPFMFMAGTDARYYYPVCDEIFRFTPYMYSMDDTARIHGNDERCKIDDLISAIKFFMNYVEKSCN